MKEFILCFAYRKMFSLCLLPGHWVDLYCKHTLLFRPVCNFHFRKNSCSCAQLSTDFHKARSSTYFKLKGLMFEMNILSI